MSLCTLLLIEKWKEDVGQQVSVEGDQSMKNLLSSSVEMKDVVGGKLTQHKGVEGVSEEWIMVMVSRMIMGKGSGEYGTRKARRQDKSRLVTALVISASLLVAVLESLRPKHSRKRQSRPRKH